MGNMLQFLLVLILCARFVLLDNVSSASVPSKTTVSTLEVTTVSTLEVYTATTKINPTNAVTVTTASVDVTTCNVNDTSCTTTVKSSNTTNTTVKATTAKLLSTTLKPATTSSPVPTTAVSNIEKDTFKNVNFNVCTCDLQRKFCDINCCCDYDCSFEDKTVFRSCKREPNLHRDTSFCQYMDYIYINNTPYEWEVNQNGLFCIAKSNLPVQHILQREQPILTLEDAELQKQNKYSWGDIDKTQTHKFIFNTTEDFVFGANIWVIKNKTLELFELPDYFVTNACLIKRNMKFLQNFKTKCSQTWINENNPSLNAETYFKNISVVRASSYFNASLFEKNLRICPGDVCLPIEAKVCDENYENCVNFSLNDTKLRVSCHLSFITNENSCLHATQRVKYNFYHNGTRGFTKIELFVVLKNISFHFGTENFVFSQEFEVNYLWSNYTFSYSLLRSGNPGYLISKPILMGSFVLNTTSANKTQAHLIIHRNPVDISDNFLVFSASKKGLCTFTNYTNVPLEFGYNTILKCTIKKVLDFKNKNLTASDLCKHLQIVIFDYWPLNRANLSAINRVVGNFGNANESLLTDWTKVISNKTPREILNETAGNFTQQNATVLCKNIVTNLKVDIFHGRVDFKQLHDQEKIFGATYNFASGKSVEFEFNENKQLDFEVVIREEVMFFDITGESVKKYVEPPTFRITLPYDFFYPFVKVGNAVINPTGCPSPTSPETRKACRNPIRCTSNAECPTTKLCCRTTLCGATCTDLIFTGYQY